VNVLKSGQSGQRGGSHAVEEWLLAVLRFAITLNEVDRATLMAVAAEMDRCRSGFTFFQRTSVKVCDAIIAKDRAQATAVLHIFARRIDRLALRRAFEAALEITPTGAHRRTNSARARENLWKGLPPRRTGT
jgi:hypothetical protein